VFNFLRSFIFHPLVLEDSNQFKQPEDRKDELNIILRNALMTGKMTDFYEAYYLPLRLFFWPFSIISIFRTPETMGKAQKNSHNQCITSLSINFKFILPLSWNI
jgi:hypothetical protein